LKVSSTVLLLIVIAACCAGIYRVQLGIDEYKGNEAYVEEFMFLPDASELKTASLGYESLVADLLWLKAVQHMGELKISDKGYDWIYRALDTVTTLDPKFLAPYETGGLILTIVADKADLSNKLLAKGYANNPGVWQLPFYLGFNYFYFMRQYKAAAKYMSIASEMEGSPKWLPLLASRLYYQADDPAYAIDFLKRMYDRTEDKRIKKGIQVRINLLKAQVIAAELQKAVDYYEKRTGKRPLTIAELVSAGIIRAVPQEPGGGRFFIDSSGKVKSSKVEEYLGVYSNRR
jgi:tetratricopeptide (TPR) repeat protein